jgi:hypothetical protein
MLVQVEPLFVVRHAVGGLMGHPALAVGEVGVEIAVHGYSLSSDIVSADEDHDKVRRFWVVIFVGRHAKLTPWRH